MIAARCLPLWVVADGNLIILDYARTPEQGAATTVLLAASPLLEGVAGGYFEDNQEQPVAQGGSESAGARPPLGSRASRRGEGTALRKWDRAG